jgi:hypothetical protein
LLPISFHSIPVHLNLRRSAHDMAGSEHIGLAIVPFVRQHRFVNFRLGREGLGRARPFRVLPYLRPVNTARSRESGPTEQAGPVWMESLPGSGRDRLGSIKSQIL